VGCSDGGGCYGFGGGGVLAYCGVGSGSLHAVWLC
jgi:hypothetical protein